MGRLEGIENKKKFITILVSNPKEGGFYFRRGGGVMLRYSMPLLLGLA